MNSRLELQTKLEEVGGTKEVYFQPPPSFMLKYPCIIYNLEAVEAKHADDIRYKNMKRYSVVVIDPDPDSVIYERILYSFKYCRFSRTYTADNLNHWVLNLYF